MWNKIWNPSNKKALFMNIVMSFALNLFLEWGERKNLADLYAFINDRTFVFLYNALIIFITLSLVFVVRKRYFVFGLISAMWAVVGLVNAVILMQRKTPFTAVDLTIAKSTIPVINSYLALWQIVLGVAVLILAIAGLVALFLYCPTTKKQFDFKTNVGIVSIFILLFGLATYLGVGRGLLISKFDNLIDGYKDYGVAYGFCVTAIDTGIDRPINYSRSRVNKIRKRMDDRLKKKDKREKRKANVIFIQLESFFDLTEVKGIELSEDPLPNFHGLQEETTSGHVTVPVYGAGTINTEFEMITGMNLAYFGTGEYPYRSILHKRTSDSMAYWMKENGYSSTVLHNNNASFYDRDYVFCNLGFDRFVSSENMDITEYNKAGWAKDYILEDYILQTLEGTKEKDYIYTISVQGHGDYPSDVTDHGPITVGGEGWDQKTCNMVTYYANEIYEMDEMIGSLIEKLSEYPEDTVLVVYGDHLPNLGFDSDDLTTGSKYKTPYLIWDNFGLNASEKKEESGNLKAYQMPSKVLAQLGITNGALNEYHQTMQGTKNYYKNLKLLQYDLLYGSGFIYENEDKLLASDLKYCVKDVEIKKLMQDKDDRLYIIGSGFTQSSRVFINGVHVPSTFVSSTAIDIPNVKIKNDDEIVVHQVSKTNENITLNQSQAFVANEDQVEILYSE